MWLILIAHPSSSFSLFSLLFFLGFFVCISIYISSLSLPWYSRIWGPWAFREMWELDKGCLKWVFMQLNRSRGYHSSWGFLVYGIAHSTRIPQPPLYLADLTTPLYSADLTAAITPGYLSRHYTWPISQPPLYPADLTAAIIPGRSHNRHYTGPISQSPFYPVDLTAAILSVWRSTFSGYFTPGAFRRMGEEDDSTSNWVYKSRCPLSWSIWQLNTLAVNWSLPSRISRLHFMATLLYTPSPLFASLIGNLLF